MGEREGEVEGLLVTQLRSANWVCFWDPKTWEAMGRVGKYKGREDPWLNMLVALEMVLWRKMIIRILCLTGRDWGGSMGKTDNVSATGPGDLSWRKEKREAVLWPHMHPGVYVPIYTLQTITTTKKTKIKTFFNHLSFETGTWGRVMGWKLLIVGAMKWRLSLVPPWDKK